MKPLVALLLAIGAFSTSAVAGDLVGLQTDALISCAGIPQGNMSVGADTYFQYETERDIGLFTQNGQFGTFNRHATGCTAIITIRDGKVIKSDIRPYGGVLTGPMACSRIFQNCER